LESVRKQTKPRTVDLYEVKWSELSPDGASALERALKKCSWRDPYKTGAQILDEFLIVDAHSVKNTDSAHAKDYDAGKKVSGIKRHISQCWLSSVGH
jgi:hypothetical protein